MPDGGARIDCFTIPKTKTGKMIVVQDDDLSWEHSGFFNNLIMQKMFMGMSKQSAGRPG
ncbi:MAG: hypothetical protein Q7T80_12645 [Methanoregula sp.]|nr:hypothetical protein [Methanoregula sp.]